MRIRDYRPDDMPAIEALYRAAFPDEDLVPLLRELAAEPAVVSLVAEDDAAPSGHVALTPCTVAETRDAVALLGPLAVAPGRQRQGIGSALVRAALARASADGIGRVCVLGDPAYYGRFGFRPEAHIAPPYPLPDEWRDAWRSAGPEPAQPGRLAVPAPWSKPALWLP